MIAKKALALILFFFASSAFGNISYALWNIDNGEVIVANKETEVRSIASITKLMNVLVSLNMGLSLDEKVKVTGSERSSHIRPGMLITRGNLLLLALVSSDNLAARTLAETSGIQYNSYIALMNVTARSLDMTDTVYIDATGLSGENRSSVVDIKKLLLETEKWQIFKNSASTTAIKVAGLRPSKKRGYTNVPVVGHNTNIYAGKLDIIAAKTGFTNSAGRCLTMYFVKDGIKYALVVLGAKNSQERKLLVDQLLDKTK